MDQLQVIEGCEPHLILHRTMYLTPHPQTREQKIGRLVYKEKVAPFT